MKKQIRNNVYWIGKIDHDIDKFHGHDFSVNHGSSQNAYLIREEKTALVDTVWSPHDKEFVHNLEQEIDLKKIDYIIINHGESDHSGALMELMQKIPGTPIYLSSNGMKSVIGQFHHPEWNYRPVKTGDVLDLGNGKKLIFEEMRMLHWPDSMATYMTEDHILFSNDAFGQHYAADGLFNDTADQDILSYEAFKYYTNILTPFNNLVSRKIEEITAMKLPIDIIAPSHGVIWRDDPLQIIDQYRKWSDHYQENQITVVYDTMAGGTALLADELAKAIRKADAATTVKVFNVSETDKNDIVSEIFRSKALVVGSPTINNSIMSSVAGFLHFARNRRLGNKKAGVFGCYGWSGEGNRELRQILTDSGYTVITEELKSNWNPTPEVLSQATLMAEELLK